MDPRIKKVPPKIGWYLAGFADVSDLLGKSSEAIRQVPRRT